jgi:hypothetical protein
VLEKKNNGSRLEQHAQGLYAAEINVGTYNEEAHGCSSAVVWHSIPAVGGSIGAVATPAVDLPGSCYALIRADRAMIAARRAVREASGSSARPRSIHGDANMSHICAAFASLRMPRHDASPCWSRLQAHFRSARTQTVAQHPFASSR